MINKIKEYLIELLSKAKENKETIFPGMDEVFLYLISACNIEVKELLIENRKTYEILILSDNSITTNKLNKEAKSLVIIINLIKRKYPDIQLNYIVREVKNKNDKLIKTDFIVKEKKRNAGEERDDQQESLPGFINTKVIGKYLDRSFSFDNFIQGESNKEVYNFCRYIAEKYKNLGVTLLIHSLPALGKTHIASAIANYIERNNYPATLYFYKKNDFIDDILNERKVNRVSAYLDEICTADIVIFDDVQMMFDRTIPFALDSFYTILDTRTSPGKKLITIFTADKPLSFFRVQVPKNTLEKEKEIGLHFEYVEEKDKIFKKLAGRITTRIESGTTIEIKKPTQKMKELYILSFFDSESLPIEQSFMDKIYYLSVQAPDNFRELKNMCGKIKDKFHTGEPMENILNDVVGAILENSQDGKEEKVLADDKEIRLAYSENIIDKILEFTSIPREGIFGKKRIRDTNVLLVRNIIMYVLYNKLKLNYKTIGIIFSCTSALISTAISQIDQQLKDEKINDYYNNILNILKMEKTNA